METKDTPIRPAGGSSRGLGFMGFSLFTPQGLPVKVLRPTAELHAHRSEPPNSGSVEFWKPSKHSGVLKIRGLSSESLASRIPVVLGRARALVSCRSAPVSALVVGRD